VYALCEGGPLFEIDPITLELKGPFNFHGKMGGFFSAHPKMDPETGEIFNHGEWVVVVVMIVLWMIQLISG